LPELTKVLKELSTFGSFSQTWAAVCLKNLVTLAVKHSCLERNTLR